ncbi:hypothetical protein HanXRQr2_Chr12g0549301 [Helianthus annuus]|uniref:Uncharacterized protein n=2 Tax=Helianthus annuus TaxID=4232 RepID=A0A9K3HHV0_HELAN|nr:hypothetical protein HanXRQr2_Chr12g0549301 [Helianthus annuus]KAJ0489973.1 hypothetical protein HanHA300_Chr12g0450081 [Helianthus annuus]KAJ0675560.1 hypothetical protein HanLR1_Chr12g0452561 [Helianthus annuus]KAJ0678838.1 hypothetical protein HanOQP8_Chr12g0452441 [Helianthus annuus]
MLLNVYKILRVESWNNQHMVTFLWPHVRAMVHPKSLEHSNLTSLLEFFTELQKEVLRLLDSDGFHSVSFYLTVGDVEMVPVMVNTIKMLCFFVTKEAVKFSTQGDFGRAVFSLHILIMSYLHGYKFIQLLSAVAKLEKKVRGVGR